MIAHVDSSVLLRLALKQARPLREFASVTRGISSRLIRAESLRTLDRLFALESISEADQARAAQFLFKAFDHLELIPVDPILEVVGNPIGLKLGTLDGIHLFSALKWKQTTQLPLIMLTHDRSLAIAAERFGIQAAGAEQ
ncbi:MAG: hypothetical protein HY537_15700 [Deltaproteobacteria bacterium]|nr:hypothetical protein [Deltaproteobacteria bacterium]